MALTKDRSEAAVQAPEPRRRGRLSSPLVLLLAIALLLLAFGWTFLRDPSISAPTRDPAWYTWRSNLMMNDDPGLIAGDWGPFSMFGGGYRVTVPLAGSILQRVAGIELRDFELDGGAEHDGPCRGARQERAQPRVSGGPFDAGAEGRHVGLPDVDDEEQRLGRQQLEAPQPLAVVVGQIPHCAHRVLGGVAGTARAAPWLPRHGQDR